ncbi:uncharacterized protein LOC131158270 [Malania oleifera]|uniref:uncharacterized protein LOC131158270 n=1 Tax=Malania oleifera TaxID=397392 RepID=UPI0025AE306D|nr:uncharacterized protein LOC131158270 [Malania oleifera]
MAFVFLLGFLFGVLAIVAVEALGLLVLIDRLKRKTIAVGASLGLSEVCRDLDSQQSLDFAYRKQGVVWVLEEDKIPIEQKRKKETLEVFPVRKYAKIKDRSLVMTNLDGSCVAIPLKGCVVAAVSASSLSSRKWAKRFPIKLENKTSVIHNGSKIFYIYLDTSWEKESWCKALRLASFDDKERIDWFFKLSEEFRSYLTSLNAGYPSFMKPFMGFYNEPVDRVNRPDGPSSKVRLFWKKLAKKASKAGSENKTSWNSLSSREERRINDKAQSFHDSVSTSGMVKTALSENNSVEESMVLPSPSAFPRICSQSHISDIDADEKFGTDEGTLCCNLLISRLFFDAKSNMKMINSLQARIQRTLSNMRIPGYIGDVICTGINIGNIPPYIHGMRVLPSDMNEVWALEIDIEYSGGAALDIETRLDVHELDFQKGIVDTSLESTSVGDVTSDLLEGFEYFGKQLKLSEGSPEALEQKDEVDPKLDGIRSSKSTLPSTHGSRWKSILNSIAKQVSQVPLSLAIKVASLRGTLRLHIKPPPSDQLWVGFTSMPDIEFSLESSVGERKITNGHIALFLVNRFKAAIRDTLVLPNCESVCIPWMLGEKDDWVARNAAPFMWVNQEAVIDQATTHEVPSNPPDPKSTRNEFSRGTPFDQAEVKCEKSKKIARDQPEVMNEKPKNIPCVQLVSESSNVSTASSSLTNPVTWSGKSSSELRTPLLSDEFGEACQQGRECQECERSSGSDILIEGPTISIEEDDAKPKRLGRKARMLDLGKKMGEKFEEKRRNIEEKGRHIVEKMRGPGSS